MTKHINIDEILGRTFAYGVDWTEYKDKSEYDHDTSMFAAKIKAQHKEALKQQLYDLMLEIIGELEYRETLDMGLSSWTNEDFKAFGRNELRIEQRQKLDNLFKGDKE